MYVSLHYRDSRDQLIPGIEKAVIASLCRKIGPANMKYGHTSAIWRKEKYKAWYLDKSVAMIGLAASRQMPSIPNDIGAYRLVVTRRCHTVGPVCVLSRTMPPILLSLYWYFIPTSLLFFIVLLHVTTSCISLCRGLKGHRAWDLLHISKLGITCRCSGWLF